MLTFCNTALFFSIREKNKLKIATCRPPLLPKLYFFLIENTILKISKLLDGHLNQYNVQIAYSLASVILVDLYFYAKVL